MSSGAASAAAGSLVEVSDGRIHGPRGVVLRGVACKLPRGGVTAIMGPSGSGKSALLRALSGQPAAPGWRVEGVWLRDGGTLANADADRCAAIGADVSWLPQENYREPHPHESFSRPPAVESWEDAFARGTTTVLLDEPLRGTSPPRLEQLVEAVREHGSRGDVVVITHDQQLARRIADRVCFVCAGEMVMMCDAKTFFGAPPTPLAEQFVRQGNCWPTTPTPAPVLPSHFRWILPDRLSGMGKPGLLRDADEDLAAISAAGVTMLVTLTMDPLPSAMLRAHGIASRHLPVRDMGVPALGKVASLCGHLERFMEGGGVVSMHCRAGIGRTGTLLAAMLCWLGRGAEEAITEVRKKQPSYIQTNGQLAFVREFAERYGR